MINIAYVPEFQENMFFSLADLVCQNIDEQRTTMRGLSESHRSELNRTADWLINSLFFAWSCHTEESLAIPLNSNAYRPTGILKARYSYTNTVKRVLPELQRMGWVTLSTKGFLNRITGEGRITTYGVTGALREAFAKNRYRWVRIKQSENLPIVIRIGAKGNRKNVPVEETPAVRKMAASIRRINEWLLDASICLHITDSELDKLSRQIVAGVTDDHVDWEPINYRRVILRRIFARGSMEKGGRFYGGWWQNIPSEYRKHIHINGKRTVECDYSGMILSLLYGRIGRPMPSGDPYDVNLPISSSTVKRGLVKKFIVANLNKEKSEFRLKPEQYATLGVTHEELLRLVKAKHPEVCNYFGSDIGVELQFVESQMTEQIMLRMLDSYNLTLLPVHDSYLVRIGYKDALYQLMQEVFKEVTGFDAKITVDYPEFHASSDSTRNFMHDYQAYMTYTMSNPNVNLD